MNLKLVKPTPELEEAYLDYISECEASKEVIVPYAARREGISYSDLSDRWSYEQTTAVCEKGFVTSTLYFLTDENTRIYGAIHIRHELNEYLFNFGGHIGYGIRPSERRKGFATKMLELALPIAKGHGIDRALITCDKSNCASARTIINNGGVLDNEVQNGEELTQRYWINL